MAYGFLPVGALASLLAHELGHYAAARSLNVPVLQVTIGVGPELLRLRNRCSWSIRLLPLGAFVRYADGYPLGIGGTAAIVLAGPTANLLTGAAFLTAAALGWHRLIPIQELLFRSYWTAIFLFVGGLSLAIGAFNLLPIPPLDGGVLALLAFQKAVGRRLSPNAARIVNTVGALTLCFVDAAGLLWVWERLAF
jgi:membrane-associated protease RseP (regulator of RpoE activity)